MWRRWNELGSLGRFELWTRAGVYVLLAAVPVLAVVLGVQHQVRVPGLAVSCCCPWRRQASASRCCTQAWAATWPRDRRRTGGWSPQPPR